MEEKVKGHIFRWIYKRGNEISQNKRKRKSKEKR